MAFTTAFQYSINLSGVAYGTRLHTNMGSTSEFHNDLSESRSSLGLGRWSKGPAARSPRYWRATVSRGIEGARSLESTVGVVRSQEHRGSDSGCNVSERNNINLNETKTGQHTGGHSGDTGPSFTDKLKEKAARKVKGRSVPTGRR
ncbi:hypothetical protein AB1N83_005513 [Pleurotus pulmonarius]